MSRQQVDSIGDVAADESQRFVDGGVREIEISGNSRARQRESAWMNKSRGIGVAEKPNDQFGADGALAAPIFGVRGVVRDVVGIVAGPEPRDIAQRRCSQEFSF